MSAARGTPVRPRLGFLGVGWIGAQRLRAVAESGLAEIAVVADADPGRARTVATDHGADVAPDLDALLEHRLDGVVIATPSGQHAAQAQQALAGGVAVFCQKPLGRTAAETRRVVDAAWTADRLLGVDFCYRRTASFEAVRRLVQSGELGTLFAVDLTFHNAWAPNHGWAFDPAESGGGCVMDLGVHLVDLAAFALETASPRVLHADLRSRGRPLAARRDAVEDHAVAVLDFGGVPARLACSWNLHLGGDAAIGATFRGTEGAAEWRNVGGSFLDFTARRLRRNATETLVDPPDAWGGRTIVDWARRLASGTRFDAAAGRFVDVAVALDAIYDVAALEPGTPAAVAAGAAAVEPGAAFPEPSSAR